MQLRQNTSAPVQVITGSLLGVLPGLSHAATDGATSGWLMPVLLVLIPIAGCIAYWWAASSRNQKIQDLEAALAKSENRRQQMVDREEFQKEKQHAIEEITTLRSTLTQEQQQAHQAQRSLMDELNSTRQSLQQELSQLNSNQQYTHQQLEQQISVVRNAVQELLDITETIERWHEGMTDIMVHNKNMQKQIGDFKSIVGQIGILSLNAAIEAARAGEHGRGFAVVADEVRNLAQRTNDATSEISSLVGSIDSASSTAASQMVQMVDKCTSTTKETEAMMSSVTGIINDSKHLHDTIGACATTGFINTVKLDHIVWKNEVYIESASASGKGASALSDHNECRLGQWYFQGEGNKLYGHLSEFKALDAVHRAVHENGKLALDQVKAGNREKVLVHIEKMEKASDDVMRLLSQIEVKARAM